jgi:glycosyltransferase involved in cell wall biosynthesis
VISPGRGGASGLPLVSVVLTPRDRPGLLPIALRCYASQTYPYRELIVVDDGGLFPADEDAVAAVGGRLTRVATGASIGDKLNHGVDLARGALCQKMDDDDWYAPEFLDTMVSAYLDRRHDVCRPTVAFLAPFLFFDVQRWELRRSTQHNVSGATLFFARDEWQERPFRQLINDEDFWFLVDHARNGSEVLPVRAGAIFLAVRHGGGDRTHTWRRQANRRPLEQYLLDRPLHPGGPETVLPEWALEAYRQHRAAQVG